MVGEHTRVGHIDAVLLLDFQFYATFIRLHGVLLRGQQVALLVLYFQLEEDHT